MSKRTSQAGKAVRQVRDMLALRSKWTEAQERLAQEAASRHTYETGDAPWAAEMAEQAGIKQGGCAVTVHQYHDGSIAVLAINPATKESNSPGVSAKAWVPRKSSVKKLLAEMVKEEQANAGNQTQEENPEER